MTSESPKILQPQEGPQELFLCCPFTERFFGGGRGGGKTLAILLDWCRHAEQHGAEAHGLILRESFPALDDFQRNKAEKILPQLGWRYKVGDKIWHHPNGAWLRLGFIDKAQDEDKYQGAEYTWMCFEELTNWTEKQSYQLDKLRACGRSATGVPIRVMATGNPGGVGQDWVKRRYIEPSPKGVPFKSEETGNMTVYIHSTFDNNQILKENDPDYLNRIIGPPHLKKAWREGNWDVSPSGNIILTEWWQYYNWKPELANVAHMGPSEIPKFIGRAQSWDTAQEVKKRNDYSACITAAYTRTDVYILNVWRKKVAMPALVAQAKFLAAKWSPNKILIEGKSSGKSLRQTLKEETLLPIIEVPANDDKISRVSAATPMMEAKKVWLPLHADWLEDFVDECSSFPDGSHDDMVDALAHLLNKIRYAGSALQKADDRRSKRAPRSIYGR